MGKALYENFALAREIFDAADGVLKGIKDAIFGNVGTMISFRIGPEDSETMAKQFAPTVNEYDLINL